MIERILARTAGWWKPKAGFILSVLFMFLLSAQIPWHIGVPLILWMLVSTLGIGILGHLINDWTDIEEDRLVGKANTMERVPAVVRPFLLLVAAGIGYLPWLLVLSTDHTVIGLLTIQGCLFVLYAAKPFRLKRFPYLAALIDASYAYVLPTLFFLISLSHSTEDGIQVLALLALAGWTLPMGIRHILIHHVYDVKHDARSGQPNLAIRHGQHNLLRFIANALFPLEVTAGISFSLLIFRGTEWTSWFLLVWGFGILSTVRWRPFRFHAVLGTNAMDRFQMWGIGLLSIMLLTIREVEYSALLALYLFLVLGMSAWTPWVWLIRSILDILRSFKLRLSSVVNWSIFYFRKGFLRWPDERNWGIHYEQHLQDRHYREVGTIAIFNQNESKYSETFIAQQQEQLDHRICFYHGEPMPLVARGAGHLVHNDVAIRSLKYAVLKLLEVDAMSYEQGLLAESLLKNKVSLMIANFGQTGVKVTEVSVQTGIPLVVVFHGYDAWNTSELDSHISAYQRLFEVAVRVIGVSREICTRLEKIGCPATKLVYLPAPVAKEFICDRKTADSDDQSPIFLSVGRFSKTKAPFLLILAFNEVLKRLPSAKLHMIGGDDGEGLFETCMMLVQSLRIQDNVQFAGICNPQQVKDAMKKATVFVQHSVTTPVLNDKEGTPVSIMEAMALGMPIIASRHAGMAEILTHGVSALLVGEYELDELADAMFFLATDIDLREKVGKGAWTAFREQNVLHGNISMLADLINEHRLRI
jgi:colanic acid/amylovoran biosynthesis glycosyltransferase